MDDYLNVNINNPVYIFKPIIDSFHIEPKFMISWPCANLAIDYPASSGRHAWPPSALSKNTTNSSTGASHIVKAGVASYLLSSSQKIQSNVSEHAHCLYTS